MKRLLLSLFIIALSCFAVQAQEDGLETFYGIPFGVSIEQVKKVMAEKRTGLLATRESDLQQLIFDHCDFGGYKGSMVGFFFADNKLHTGVVGIQYDEGYKTKEEIGTLVADIYTVIQEQYGHKTELTNAFEEYGVFSWMFNNGDFIELEIKETEIIEQVDLKRTWMLRLRYRKATLWEKWDAERKKDF